MTNKAQLLKKYGSEEAVSEYYRELQKKSRENYKGTGGFAALKKSDPKRLKQISQDAARKRHASEKTPEAEDTTKS